jgi:hypothetical protein
LLALPNLNRADLWVKAYEPGAIAALAKASALRVLIVWEPEVGLNVEELVQLHQLEFLRIIPNYKSKTPRDWYSRLPNCTVTFDSSRGQDAYDWT